MFAREAIEAFTQPGETVLDPFCGGGTTLVEAVSLGRRAAGLDDLGCASREVLDFGGALHSLKVRARAMRAIVRALRWRVSAHSHTRKTVQPVARNVRVTTRSRCAFRVSFAAHHSRRVAGFVA